MGSWDPPATRIYKNKYPALISKHKGNELSVVFWDMGQENPRWSHRNPPNAKCSTVGKPEDFSPLEKMGVTKTKHLVLGSSDPQSFFVATFHVLLNPLHFTLCMKKEASLLQKSFNKKASRNMFGTLRHHLCPSCFPLQPSSDQNLGCLLY